MIPKAARNSYLVSMGYPDERRYRVTPEGQPKLNQLVQPGMTVRTSYNTGGTVSHVSGPYLYRAADGLELEHFTIVYVKPDVYGHHSQKDYHWLNEYVAVDGRILQLFEAGTDEVFIVDGEQRFPQNRKGQLALF